MKKEVLDRCENSSSLCKLDFHLEQNHLKHPDLGFGADTVIKDKLKRDETTKADVKLFKDSCRVFLKAVTCKFVKKSPLQYAVVRNATCLVLEIICNHETLAKESLKGLVSNLILTKWITRRNGDEINSEYKRYSEKVAVGNRESFLRFSKLKNRSDEFYFFSVGGLDEYLPFNRDSVKRARRQQRIDVAERNKQESDNARKRKRDGIVTGIKELEAKKRALEKVEKKLKLILNCC